MLWQYRVPKLLEMLHLGHMMHLQFQTGNIKLLQIHNYLCTIAFILHTVFSAFTYREKQRVINVLQMLLVYGNPSV